MNKITQKNISRERTMTGAAFWEFKINSPLYENLFRGFNAK